MTRLPGIQIRMVGFSHYLYFIEPKFTPIPIYVYIIAYNSPIIEFQMWNREFRKFEISIKNWYRSKKYLKQLHKNFEIVSIKINKETNFSQSYGSLKLNIECIKRVKGSKFIIKAFLSWILFLLYNDFVNFSLTKLRIRLKLLVWNSILKSFEYNSLFLFIKIRVWESFRIKWASIAK